MMFLQGPFIGAQPAAWSELFPATVRYSGVSLSQTIGTILGGALAPIIATTLFGLTGNSWLDYRLPRDAVADFLALRVAA